MARPDGQGHVTGTGDMADGDEWFSKLIGQTCTLDDGPLEVRVKVVGVSFVRKQVCVVDQSGTRTLWIDPAELRECKPNPNL